MRFVRRVLDTGDRLMRVVLFYFWRRDSYRPRLPAELPVALLTVIVCAYSPRRQRNLDPLLRHVLACPFVERVIISNNNPSRRIEDFVSVRDGRLTLLDQPVRRGPGYCWELGLNAEGRYFIMIDDDCLLTARQVALLFRALLDAPVVPHGVSGKLGARYLVSTEAEVNWLFNAYAVTRSHLERYAAAGAVLARDYDLSPEAIEFWADDIVISEMGDGRARIHDLGYLRLCPTSDAAAVAIHLQEAAPDVRQRAREAVASLKAVAR